MRRPWLGFHSGIPNRVVCGRRFCPICGRWRIVSDFAISARHQLDSYCQACRRVQARRRRRERSPETAEAIREYQRFYTEAVRRRRGAPVRQFKNRRTVVDRVERVFLPPEPLLELISDLEDGSTELSRLVERAGVSNIAIRRYRRGESSHVRLDVADRITHALGVPLASVYPPEE